MGIPSAAIKTLADFAESVLPRAEQVERAANVVKHSGDKSAEMFARNDQLGTAYEIAQISKNRYALSIEDRIPHILDLETEKWTTGESGQFHKDIISKTKSVPDGKYFYAKNKAFIGEFPGQVSWDMEGTENTLSQEQKNKAIRLMQEKFNKPIVLDRKIFGTAATIAGGTAIAGTAQAGEPKTLADFANQGQETSTFGTLSDFAAKHDTERFADRTAAGLPNDLLEAAAQSDADNNSFLETTKQTLYNMFVKNDLDARQKQAEQAFPDSPNMQAAVQTAADFNPIPTADALKNMVLGGLKASLSSNLGGVMDTRDAAQKAEDAFHTVELGMNALVFAGIAKSAMRIPAKLAEKAYFQTKPLPEVSSEEISKAWSEALGESPFHSTLRKSNPENLDAVVAQAVKENGELDVEMRLKQLDMEYRHFYDLDPESLAKYEAQTHSIPIPKAQQEIFPDVLKLPTGEPLPSHPVTAQIASESLAAAENTIPLQDMATADPIRWSNMGVIWRHAVVSVAKVLDSVGPLGRDILSRMVSYLDKPEVYAAMKMYKLDPLLKKLSTAETKNFVDVTSNARYANSSDPLLKKLAKPTRIMNQKVQQAADLWLSESKELFERARSNNIPVAAEWTGHYPQRPTKEAFSMWHEKRVVAHLVETGQADSAAEGRRLYQAQIDKYANHTERGLEQERLIHANGYDTLKFLKYSVNPRRDLYNYFLAGERRIQDVIQFGNPAKAGNDTEVILEQIAKLRQTHPQAADYAQAVFQRVTGREKFNPYVLWAMQKMNRLAGLTMLTAAAPLQLMSMARTAGMFGPKAGLIGAYKSIKSVFSKATREEINQTGAVYTHFLSDLNDSGTMNTLSRRLARGQGVGLLDEYTRIYAGHAAKPFLNDMVKALTSKETGFSSWGKDKWERVAKRTDLYNIIKSSKGNLTLEQQNEAVKRLVDRAVGRVRTTELPLMMSHPLLQPVMLFKKFVTEHGRFVKDELIKEAFKGNLKPLATYGMVGLPMAEMIRQGRNSLMHREQETGFNRFLSDMVVMQPLGIFGDLISQAAAGHIKDYAVGPFFSSVSRVLESGVKATVTGKSKDLDPAIQELTRRFTGLIPIFGQGLNQEAQGELSSGYDQRRKQKQIQQNRKVNQRGRELGWQ